MFVALLAGVIFIAAVLVCTCVTVHCLRLKWSGQHQYPRPIWSTVLSYYNRNLRIESDGSTPVLPHPFHNFIRRDVIDIFNQQRTQRDQFAALLFIHQDVDVNTIDTSVSFYTTDVKNKRLLTDTSYPFWPIDPQNFGNFMVARPEPSWSQHAEEILLEHFPTIWKVYLQQEGQPPKYVILYSWTMPCAKRCTPKLVRCITSSNKYTESTKFIVAYTIYWKKENESDIQHSKRLLLNHDVVVEKVDYDRKLLPSFEEQCRASVTPPPMSEASTSSNVEATPPPIDRIGHRPRKELDMRRTLDKLRDLNLDDDKQLTLDTNISQDVPPQQPISFPFSNDSPWEGLSQAESTEGDLELTFHGKNDEWQLHTNEQKFDQKVPIPLPMHLPYKSESPWEALSQTESTEGDLSLHDENEWPLLTKEQRVE